MTARRLLLALIAAMGLVVFVLGACSDDGDSLGDQDAAAAELRRKVAEGELPVPAREFRCTDDSDCGPGLIVDEVVFQEWGPAPGAIRAETPVSDGFGEYSDVTTVAGFPADWLLLADDGTEPILLVGPANYRRPTSATDAADRESTLCGTEVEALLDTAGECSDGMLLWEVEVDDPPDPPGDIANLSGVLAYGSSPTRDTLAGLADGTVDHPRAHPTPEAAIVGQVPDEDQLDQFELYRRGYRILSRSEELVVAETVTQSWYAGAPWVEQIVSPHRVEQVADGIWWATLIGPDAVVTFGEGEAAIPDADAAWEACCDATVTDTTSEAVAPTGDATTTLPPPTTTGTTTTPTTEALVASPPVGEVPFPLLAFVDAARIAQVGTDGTVEVRWTGPVGAFADDGQGGVIAQRPDWTDGDSTIFRVRNGASEVEPLVEPLEDERLILEGVVVLGDETWVLYQRDVFGAPADAEITLWRRSLVTGADERLAVTGGWEASTEFSTPTDPVLVGLSWSGAALVPVLVDASTPSDGLLDTSIDECFDGAGFCPDVVAHDGDGSLVGVGPLWNPEEGVGRVGLSRVPLSGGPVEEVATWRWDNGFWYPEDLFVIDGLAVLSRSADPDGRIPARPLVIDLTTGESWTLPIDGLVRPLLPAGAAP